MTDLAAYKHKVETDSKSVSEGEFAFEQPRVWFEGHGVRKIVVDFYTSDFEFMDTWTYYLRTDGRVWRARAVYSPSPGDYGNYKVDKYIVRHGDYVRVGNSNAEEVDIPKRKTLPEFPYFKVMSGYQSAWTSGEICG
jgi:hypothetical protein